MFYIISRTIGIILFGIAALLNLAVCFFEALELESAHASACRISVGCRWIGMLYFVLAWFTGSSTELASGADIYSQIAFCLAIFSIIWIIVFFVSLLSRLWSSRNNLTWQSLACALICFVVGYLLH